MLGTALRDQQRERPFRVEAIVLLPDHLHVIWTLPGGDANYPLRWSAIKGQFTRDWLAAGGVEQPLLPGRAREGRRGVWQPRFIEHTIRDEEDFCAHVDYIHYNPVKHNLVHCPKDWPWSSFARYVASGDYPLDWGCRDRRPPASLDLVDADLLE
jgi:putative transposase